MAAHNLNIGPGTGFLYLGHHFLNILLRDLLRKKNGQHHTYGLRSAACQVVNRNLYGQGSHILHRSRDGIRGNYKNLSRLKPHGRTVLSHAGA